MMQQYHRIKKKYKNMILFFRLGDFYEMFQSDAKEVSRLLNLTLTKRHGIPMCGIPYHASSNYIKRLLNLGKKIAICEQVSQPGKEKKIVERKVVQVITPGTIIEEDYLEKTSNNYLLATGKSGNIFLLSYIDLSTGEFYTTSFANENGIESLRREIIKLQPREIIMPESLLNDYDSCLRFLKDDDTFVINKLPDWSYDLQTSREVLKRHFGTVNLKAFGLGDDSPEIICPGVILDYLAETALTGIPHINAIHLYGETDYLGLDEASIKNLEIIRNLRDAGGSFTLCKTLDKTRTAMGARKLKKWLLQPLTKVADINARQNVVAFFYHHQSKLTHVRDRFSRMLDIERLSAKLALDRAHAKDLVAIRKTLDEVAFLHTDLGGAVLDFEEFRKLSDVLEATKPVVDLITRAIKEDPSILLAEGNMISPGYNKELDEYRDIRENSKGLLEEYITHEKEETGIRTLRVKYNKIIGYFIEVTKSNLSSVPEHFIKRQSLVNSERFTTEKLIDLETKINSAYNTITELEKALFLEVRDEIKKYISSLMKTAHIVSDLDCLQSMSYASTVYGYNKPVVSGEAGIRIVEGRHPVVEENLPQGEFIPNDFSSGGDSPYFSLITGPNMAGKSTYLRQTALIVLMAQCGCFVPVSEARIGIVDKIFCRVGASDNLARGESTFLVEMNETAHILRSATDRSLIIMDEVGRGTSTNDGLSIAWAVSEYLLDKVKAVTLFATHYHELTLLKHGMVQNLSMAVSEDRGEIIFLKKVIEGSASNSYGIHVAQIAGIPDEVIERSYNILTSITRNRSKVDVPSKKNKQQMLFPNSEAVIQQIKNTDFNTMTPLESLNLACQWKKLLSE